MMLFGNKKSATEKEWENLQKRELQFCKKQMEKKTSFLNEKLSGVVPAQLESNLQKAFYKAFELVFEKGTAVIEKTYRKDEKEYQYQMNTYAADLRENKKNVRAFRKNAQGSKRTNLLISGVEGIGMGILGIGIPDIPVFTAVLLKSVYEIALSYGFSYETEEEQIFILRLIATALYGQEEFEENNSSLNRWIDERIEEPREKQEWTKQAADALSKELLYMKFLQGIPVAGVVGGLADAVYLKRITDYADLKYYRRFLNRKRGV